MTSLRSHFRQHLQQNVSTNSQQKQSSRIPTKASAAEASKPSKAAQQVSKLAKRASRSIATEPALSKSSTKAAALSVPLIAESDPTTTQSKRTSVAMSSATTNRHSLLPAPPAIRTPSLVSGSSASTFDSPRSNRLRRKPSAAIESYAAQQRAESAEGDVDRRARRSRSAFEETVLGISIPYMPSYGGRDTPMEHMLGSHQKQEWPMETSFSLNATPPVPPPSSSLTPSTRFTDSPFSYVPTPSSASSYSSSIVATSNVTARERPSSPKRSQQALPPLRESSTSSGSTVRNPSTKLSIPRNDSSRKPNTTVLATQQADVGRSPSKAKLTKNAPKRSSIAQQAPPELAHLNVEPPPRPPVEKPLPPIRPSRDGTLDLVGMENPAPVVQSDLPRLYTTYHKRTPSQETPVSAPSPGFKTRFGFSPKAPIRSESPRVDSAVSPPPAARRWSRAPTPDVSAAEGASLKRRDSPAVSASPSRSSRFAFLSRKSKVDVSKPTEKPKRAPTKGPAAGTGHEGYGRFGFRGRSGSTTSSNGFRSSSADSTASSATRARPSRQSSLASKDGSELDDFLKERLNPVILRGSGASSVNKLSNVAAETAPHSVASQASSLDSLPRPHLMPSIMQDAVSGSPQKRPSLGRSRPSDNSEGEFSTSHRSLAARRSLTRMSRSKSRSPIRVPPPINTDIAMQQSSIDSYDAETSAWPQTDSTIPPSGEAFHGQEGLWFRSQQEPAKPARKLNFFQRALASPRDKGKAKAVENKENRRSVAHSPTHRGLSHYALLDPVESVGLDEVGRIVQENEAMTESSTSEEHLQPKMVPYENRHVSLLPAPPRPDGRSNDNTRSTNIPSRIKSTRQDSSESVELLRAKTLLPRQSANVVHIQRSPSLSQGPDSAGSKARATDSKHGKALVDSSQTALATPELGATDSPKQSRLSPIGRIPKVVSRRDRDRKLPDASFSRPFARTQPRPSVKPPGSVYSQIREMASPIEFGPQPTSTTSTRSGGNSGESKSSNVSDGTAVSTNRTSILPSQDEFFAFDRNPLTQSISTSSGNSSRLSAMFAQLPQQEDHWDEYNDFIDEVIPSRSRAIAPGSRTGAPSSYANAVSEPYSTFNIPSLVGPAPTWDLPLPPGMAPLQTVLTVPQQISQFLQPSASPMTPDTLAGFISGYGNRSTSTLFLPNRASLPATQRSSIPRQPVRSSLSSVRESLGSSRYSQASYHSRSASFPDSGARNSRSSRNSHARFNQDTQQLETVELDDKPQITANLRRGALMTSKWLSFGQVLFSPAHNEIKFAEEPRILVIDGLSSDWSYYVALSYPAADVYHLGLSVDDSDTPKWPDADRKPPLNHRAIRLSTMSSMFPFPKGFFTAVVYRFPTATTEHVHQACISECKRVLRPGGYLEVAVLDLDLMNMSAKARKAVRDLKTRMQETDRDVCLSNLSDVLVRLIGRRGFDDVQRCIVGVPAAGRIPRSRDVSSVSSDGSGRPIWHREDHSTPEEEQEFSFTDLMRETQAPQIGPGKRNDESITKMVAKVGRWWYSACYERSLLPGDRSIWADRGLLRECEKQGTSFRLLICHAQKPMQPRRRTVSV